MKMKCATLISLSLLQITGTCSAGTVGVKSAATLPSTPKLVPPPSSSDGLVSTIHRAGDIITANANEDDGTLVFRQAAQVGLVTAAMGHIYGQILDKTVTGVWNDIPSILQKRGVKVGPSYIAYTCALGGLIMGLLSSQLKPTFVVAEFVSALSGSASDATLLPDLLPVLPHLLFLSLVTSTFGFSVGPEAPMVCAGGLVGLAMARNWSDNQEKSEDSRKRTAEIMTYAGSAGALTAFMGIPLAG